MQLQNLPIYSYHNLGDLNYMRGVLCFRYKDRPESQQLSDSPTVGDPSIEWGNVTVGLDGRFQFTIMPAAEFPKEVRTTDGELWRPLRECPASCSGRGSCQQKDPGEAQDGSTQPSQPHCVCHAFFVGDACDTPVPSYCYRNCSGVGTCGRRGFCHCQPGIWGLGCTRRKAYVSDKGWQPNHAEMKIYVYDTPQNVVHRQDRDDNWSPHNSNPMIYGAELWFLEKLLGDWTVRTENPWEAALFFVPDFCYFHIGNLGLQHAFFEHITRYLESRPWFNLTVGRNHILTATGDRGVCSLYQELPDGVRPAIHNTIKMVHFGQSPPHHLAAHHHSRHHAHNVTHPPPPPEERFPGFDSFRQ
ncbi:hypothetical protein HYH03_008282 [Edaphochlamys debaryana]|uniref:EGF-like domain-containing protein n=1 Tax=Edaphochlamys debaryana TaxID=47281 RepID=A0A836BYD0_9CHLO|nr:hypothetical protein HYH03_008282 [Edaphochlamys debaryana]|eukprot:KAG2493465.1 hypothetical protein HYH03_008282 [Edaphochlamys debaryana]